MSSPPKGLADSEVPQSPTSAAPDTGDIEPVESGDEEAIEADVRFLSKLRIWLESVNGMIGRPRQGS